MSRVDVDDIAAFGVKVAGHPVTWIDREFAADVAVVAARVLGLSRRPTFVEFAATLEVVLEDAVDAGESEGRPPGELYWLTLHELTPDGVTTKVVHVEACEGGGRLAYYAPLVEQEETPHHLPRRVTADATPAGAEQTTGPRTPPGNQEEDTP